MSPARLAAIATILAFLAGGIVGHDPWKPDEAYTFGLVQHILETGDWVVPTLAGEPFVEKPPLFYVVAAGSAALLSPWLAPHDGARVAALLFVALAMGFTALCARRLHGAGNGQAAALLLAGSFGLLLHAHQLVTDTALLAGFAVAMAGLVEARERPFRGGALLGTGVGMGFLSKGLLAPAAFALACGALPMVCAGWRTPRYVTALSAAALCSAPWLLAWPVALHARDPALFNEWLFEQNLGRFLGQVRLGATAGPWFYVETLPWFTLPSGALVAWWAWRCWRLGDAQGLGRMLVPAAVAATLLWVLAASSVAREMYALPILVPLAILAAPAARALPRGAGVVAASATGVVALVLVALAWRTWAGDMLGIADPPRILLRWLPAGFHFPFDAGAVAVAAAATLAWMALFTPGRASWLHLWAANVAVAWLVWMTLMLPWIDAAKSFRAPFAEIAGRTRGDCVSSIALGEPERAMLHYVAGLDTQRAERGRIDCPWLLVQSAGDGRLPAFGGDWRLAWEGARPGERRERFQLWAVPAAAHAPRAVAAISGE